MGASPPMNMQRWPPQQHPNVLRSSPPMAQPRSPIARPTPYQLQPQASYAFPTMAASMNAMAVPPALQGSHMVRPPPNGRQGPRPNEVVSHRTPHLQHPMGPNFGVGAGPYGSPAFPNLPGTSSGMVGANAPRQDFVRPAPPVGANPAAVTSSSEEAYSPPRGIPTNVSQHLGMDRSLPPNTNTATIPAPTTISEPPHQVKASLGWIPDLDDDWDDINQLIEDSFPAYLSSVETSGAMEAEIKLDRTQTADMTSTPKQLASLEHQATTVSNEEADIPHSAMLYPAREKEPTFNMPKTFIDAKQVGSTANAVPDNIANGHASPNTTMDQHHDCASPASTSNTLMSPRMSNNATNRSSISTVHSSPHPESDQWNKNGLYCSKPYAHGNLIGHTTSYSGPASTPHSAPLSTTVPAQAPTPRLSPAPALVRVQGPQCVSVPHAFAQVPPRQTASPAATMPTRISAPQDARPASAAPKDNLPPSRPTMPPATKIGVPSATASAAVSTPQLPSRRIASPAIMPAQVSAPQGAYSASTMPKDHLSTSKPAMFPTTRIGIPSAPAAPAVSTPQIPPPVVKSQQEIFYENSTSVERLYTCLAINNMELQWAKDNGAEATCDRYLASLRDKEARYGVLGALQLVRQRGYVWDMFVCNCGKNEALILPSGVYKHVCPSLM
ncbi:hypothetical protein BDY21DRAFT_330186 [Lineolata rhizophorae]|uniref:Uncharacterized protein n=1 Tax=Lineolata rhizophorae TaxID=578093 RepID=A0A6A6PE04_9PEZI|nr:hypothetical protein BDY21DRAFT_330186 [Lineolata rhizophorae]